MSGSDDVLHWIQSEIAAQQPAALPTILPILNRARHFFGGATIYVRQSPPVTEGRIQTRQLSQRTIQARRKRDQAS